MKPALTFFLILVVFGCSKNDLDNNSVTTIELTANKTEVVLNNIIISDTILIESNTAWTVNIDTSQKWITVTPMEDSGSVELVISSNTTNNTGSDRSTQIQVVSKDGSETVSINVLQQ